MHDDDVHGSEDFIPPVENDEDFALWELEFPRRPDWTRLFCWALISVGVGLFWAAAFTLFLIAVTPRV